MASEGGSPDEKRRARRRLVLAIFAGALVLLVIRLHESTYGGCRGGREGPKLPPDPTLPGGGFL